MPQHAIPSYTLPEGNVAQLSEIGSAVAVGRTLSELIADLTRRYLAISDLNALETSIWTSIAQRLTSMYSLVDCHQPNRSSKS